MVNTILNCWNSVLVKAVPLSETIISGSPWVEKMDCRTLNQTLLSRYSRMALV